MITSAVAMVVLGGLQRPHSSLLTPQIKQEITRVIALSNNGKLPGFWPNLTEDDWEVMRVDGSFTDLMVGGWIRVRFDLARNRIAFFTCPFPAVARGTPAESREAMLARAAQFDRDMGLPQYAYVETWIPSFNGPLPDGSSRPPALDLRRAWPGNPVPYGLGSQSGMVIEPENHNIRIWSNGIYSPPPIGPPPAFLPSEALQIQAVAACLDLRPEHVAKVGAVEITLNAVRRWQLTPDSASRPGTTLWRRPLTPTQLYAQQQGLSIYVADIRVGLIDAAGNGNMSGTVKLDPATGQVDEVLIRRTARRGAEVPVSIAAPPPARRLGSRGMGCGVGWC